MALNRRCKIVYDTKILFILGQKDAQKLGVQPMMCTCVGARKKSHGKPVNQDLNMTPHNKQCPLHPECPCVVPPKCTCKQSKGKTEQKVEKCDNKKDNDCAVGPNGQQLGVTPSLSAAGKQEEKPWTPHLEVKLCFIIQTNYTE